MIQRIQSIFLLLVAAGMTLFLIFPLWIKFNADTGELYQITACQLNHIDGSGNESKIYFPYIISAGLAFLSIVVALFEIFQYKNRLNQIKMGAINSLIMAGALITAIYLTYTGQTDFIPEIRGKYMMGVFFPVGALLFNSLANRFIRKDEELVRSVDRIR
ncbi:DUF4293 domain-containing protein [Bacteroidota bacterium]